MARHLEHPSKVQLNQLGIVALHEERDGHGIARTTTLEKIVKAEGDGLAGVSGECTRCPWTPVKSVGDNDILILCQLSLCSMEPAAIKSG